MLLVWADGHENFFAQCANVGDSACVIKYVLLDFYIYLLIVVICHQDLSLHIIKSYHCLFCSSRINSMENFVT